MDGIGLTEKGRTVWTKLFPWIEASPYIFAVLLNIIIGAEERNGMAITGFFFAFIAYAFCWFLSVEYLDTDSGEDSTTLRGMLIALYLALAVVAAAFPYVHLAGDDKVWIADGETTLSRDVLIRTPGSAPATSVRTNQNITVEVAATTRDNAPIAGQVHVSYRLTGNEEELLHALEGSRDPNQKIRGKQESTIREHFAAIASQKDFSEFVTKERQIEFALGERLSLRELGIKRNGNVTVYNLRVSFVDK